MDQTFEEDGRPVPAVEFDWEAIEDCGPQTDLQGLSDEDVERGLMVLRALLSWIWQNGSRNPEGLKLRAMVICWLFLKELRPLKLSELARGFGLKKQSVGRQVEDFKKHFPGIRSPHMKIGATKSRTLERERYG